MNGPVFEIVDAYVHPGGPGQVPYECYKIVDMHESYNGGYKLQKQLIKLKRIKTPIDAKRELILGFARLSGAGSRRKLTSEIAAAEVLQVARDALLEEGLIVYGSKAKHSVAAGNEDAVFLTDKGITQLEAYGKFATQWGGWTSNPSVTMLERHWTRRAKLFPWRPIETVILTVRHDK